MTTAQKLQQARADLKEDPNDANSLYNLGLALMKVIDPALRKGTLNAGEQEMANEAESLFLKALKVTDNTHGRAAIMLAMLYQFQARYSEGVPYARIGLQLPPDSADYAIAASVATVCLSESGSKQEALATVQEALQHHPDNANLQQYYQILASEQATYAMPSMGDKEQAMNRLAEELQQQMEAISESGEPADTIAAKMAKAQENYQKKLQALFS